MGYGQRKKGHPCISVKDTGIGVPMKYQSRIFERFFRVDKSHSKQTGGTGLGLSIVKHVVEYYGGYIGNPQQNGRRNRNRCTSVNE